MPQGVAVMENLIEEVAATLGVDALDVRQANCYGAGGESGRDVTPYGQVVKNNTLPELFAAARLDGASELRILWSIAMPLVRPALMTAILLTFIGPWNEFLWPFLITKDPALQPLAVSLANYITTVAASASNPFGAILAGAVVLAIPAVVLFVIFQRHFQSSDIGSGVKG